MHHEADKDIKEFMGLLRSGCSRIGLFDHSTTLLLTWAYALWVSCRQYSWFFRASNCLLLDQVSHIFGYLTCNKCTEQWVEWNKASFEQHDWADYYQEAKEVLPPNAPTPQSNAVRINCFVDADYTKNRETRWSQTGILIFLLSRECHL